MNESTAAASAEGGTFTLDLEPGSGAVVTGREFARHVLTSFGWLPAADPQARTAAEDVLLLVSELVTNACRHGKAPYRLVLRRIDGGVRVEMADASTELPVLAPDRPAVPGGFGMRLVLRLTREWGVTPIPEGKVVWLEVDR